LFGENRIKYDFLEVQLFPDRLSIMIIVIITLDRQSL